jgi:hypothetical protein
VRLRIRDATALIYTVLPLTQYRVTHPSKLLFIFFPSLVPSRQVSKHTQRLRTRQAGSSRMDDCAQTCESRPEKEGGGWRERDRQTDRQRNRKSGVQCRQSKTTFCKPALFDDAVRRLSVVALLHTAALPPSSSVVASRDARPPSLFRALFQCLKHYLRRRAKKIME